MKDSISDAILRIIRKSNEPLGTQEICCKVRDSKRSKIMYRLSNLRSEGKILGKNIVSGKGKGIWVFWRKNAFKK